MGYLFLTLALFAGVTKGYCGKKTSGFVASYRDSMLMNSVRMLLCIVISLVFTLISENAFSAFTLSPKVILICLLSGISMAGFVVTWVLSVQRGAYMMVEISLLLGVLVPMLCCSFLYSEEIKAVQWAGLAILAAATYIMTTYNRSRRGKMSVGTVILFVMCGCFSGVSDLSQKLFVHEIPEIGVSCFNLFTYTASSAVLLICWILSSRKEENRQDVKKFLAGVFPYLCVMSVCLFLNSFFKTLAASALPSAVMYPMSQGGSMILSLAMSALFFGEKITWRSALGASLAFIALIVMNL